MWNLFSSLDISVLSSQLGSLIYLSNNIIPQDEVVNVYFFMTFLRSNNIIAKCRLELLVNFTSVFNYSFSLELRITYEETRWKEYLQLKRG